MNEFELLELLKEVTGAKKFEFKKENAIQMVAESSFYLIQEMKNPK